MALDLLNAVRSRAESKGIGTADFYLRQFEQCLDGSCPSQYFNGLSPFRWRKGLEAAANKLVYHHPEMDFDGDFERFEKAASKESLPPNTIATFPAIITTTTQDRDGDVLETGGADLDAKAPLLYQHMPFETVGRLLLPGKHTKKLLTGKFTICGTPLGEDVALLAEHGALRISHGFLASKFEPLEGEAGFHILEFKILEVSLVSIPSNPDAEITAFSRDKLHHPLVKALAGVKFAARPVISAVPIDVAALAGALPDGTSVTFSKTGAKASDVHDSGAADGASCGCKSHAEQKMATDQATNEHVPAPKAAARLQRKGVYVEFENSFDDIRCDLNDSLLAYLISAGEADSNDSCYIVDLFLYQALVQVCPRSYCYGPYDCGPYYYDDSRYYYLLDWEMGADDEPVWSGSPQAVEITPQITALDKRAFAMYVKSLPAKHVRAMSKAMGHCAFVMDHDEATKAVADLASKAHAAIKGVHEAHDKAAGLTAEQTKQLTKAMGYCDKGAENDEATPEMQKRFKSAGTLLKDVTEDSGDMGGEESLETMIEKSAKAGRKLSAANEKRIKSAASNFKAIADDDESHKSVAELAGKGYGAIKSIFASGGDSASDYDADGNYTGDDMGAYTAAAGDEGKSLDADAKEKDIDAVKAGRAVSKGTAAKIRESITHGDGVVSHEQAQDHHKSLARRAVKKLKAVLGEDTSNAAGEDDADGSMSLHGGNVLGAEQDGKNAAEVCDKLLSNALLDYAMSGDFAPLKGVADFAKKALDTTSRIDKQRQFDAEEALVNQAAASV